MEIFISWSGAKSESVANALRNWLPQVINALKPWLSCADIDKGSRWGVDVAGRLESARAGILCVTSSNARSEWLLFEAGALSKTIQNTFVCPLLIDLDPSDVKGPLAQFQATRATKGDILRLVKTLNASLREDSLPETQLEEAFDVWWPKLKKKLEDLPSEIPAVKPERTEKDLLKEILGLVRTQNRYFNLSFTESSSPLGRQFQREITTGSSGTRGPTRQEVTTEISRAIRSRESDIQSVTVSATEGDTTFLIEPRYGRPCSVIVPASIALSDIDRFVGAQILANGATSGVDEHPDK